MTPCVIRNSSCGWKNLDDPKFHIEYDAYFTLPVHAFRHVSVAQSVYDDNSAVQCFPAHILLSHAALRLWMQVNDADRCWKKLHFRQSRMRAACSPTLGLTTATVCSRWQFNTDSPKWHNAFGNLRESYEELQRVPASFDKCFSTCSWGTFFFLSTYSALRSEDRLEMEPPLLHPRGWKSTPAAGGQRNSSIKPSV